MAIDYEIETLVPFNEARSAFPGGRNLALQTLHRWRLHGIHCANGLRVKLETILVGGLRYTSAEAIRRFVDAQNVEPQSASKVTPNQRAAQSKAAKQSLLLAGVGTH